MYRKFVAGPLMDMDDKHTHEPVMVAEVLEALPLGPGAIVVDGTLGLAGHSLRMAERIPGGMLIGLDWDQSMLVEGAALLEPIPGVRFEFRHTDYRDLPGVVAEVGVQPNAILLDLGLNSAQIDDPQRGISFKENGPLDMRMNRAFGEPVAAILNRMTPGQIEEMLIEYGDERWARAIAKVIVERRKTNPLRTTQDLVECVLDAIPPRARDKQIHPATRTFQACRVYVNAELDDLQQCIEEAAKTLSPGGVLVVLSYHSGEDRPTKLALRHLSSTGDFDELTKKPLTPTEEEVRRNPRSRSAKLRAIKRKEKTQS